MITLVLGGARSGKSGVAEQLAGSVGWAGDVRRHGVRRSWRCRPRGAGEPPIRPGATRAGPRSRWASICPLPCEATAGTVLLDSLGTWVTAHPDLAPDVRRAVRRARARAGDTVVVSEEVGLGCTRRRSSAVASVTAWARSTWRSPQSPTGCCSWSPDACSRWSGHEARSGVPDAARRGGRAGRAHAVVVPGRGRADRRRRRRRLVGCRRSCGRRPWRPRSWWPSTSRSPGCCTWTGSSTAPTACCPRSRARGGWRSWPSRRSAPTAWWWRRRSCCCASPRSPPWTPTCSWSPASGPALVPAMAVTARAVPYARAEGGLASAFTGGDWRPVGLAGLILAVSLGAFAGGRQSELAVALGIAGQPGRGGLRAPPPRWVHRRRPRRRRRDRRDGRPPRGGGNMVNDALGAAIGLVADRLLGEPPASRAPGGGVRPRDAGAGAADLPRTGAVPGWCMRRRASLSARWPDGPFARPRSRRGRLSPAAALARPPARSATRSRPVISIGRASCFPRSSDAMPRSSTRRRSPEPSSSRWPRTPSTPSWPRHCGRWSRERRVCSPIARSTRWMPWSATTAIGTSATAGPPLAWTTPPPGCPPERRRCSWPRAALTPRARCGARSVATLAAHPSPNSGVAEAAFAAALGLRLGGESRYGDRVELRPPLGDGRSPEPSDIAAAVRLSHDVGLAVAAALAVTHLAARVGRNPRLLCAPTSACRPSVRTEARWG